MAWSQTERIAHVMKAQTRTQYPGNLLFWDTETKGKPNPNIPNQEDQWLWFGHSVAFRYENFRRTRQASCTFKTVPEFWRFVESRLDPRRPLWCFAHNATFDLTICDFWRFSEGEDMTTELAVLEDPPLILKMRWKDCSLIIVDTLNYWRTSLKTLGESIGVHKTDMPEFKAPLSEWLPYCKQDVEVTAAAIEYLIRFLAEHDLGKFAMTIASQSMTAYRHRFMKHPIFIHTNTGVLELEREAYFGGLVHCAFIGKVNTKTVYHYDINSLYPFVMQNMVPTKLVFQKENGTPKGTLRLLGDYGGCARVRIRTNKATYPKRYGGRLIEAQGDFETTLCGPELEQALQRGDVISVGKQAYYEMAPIFTEFVDYFWTLRQKYKKEKNEVWRYFCKIFMNSLYGKFGQHANDWHDLTPENLANVYNEEGKDFPDCYLEPGFEPDVCWSQHKWSPVGLGRILKIRALSGQVQFNWSIGEHHESSPIIAAYITSYARSVLRDYIGVAGSRHVFYYDTDSLFVDGIGRRNLIKSEKVDSERIGCLKLEGEANDVSFFCPKDYIFGKLVVRKGIRKDAIKISECTFRQKQFEGVKSVMRRETLPYIGIKMIEKTNRRLYTKGERRSDGWVDFLTLDE
jgi:hypothetical protein